MMKRRKKRKNRREKETSGDPRKVSPSIYFPPRETFFDVKNVLSALRPPPLGKNHPQWDYGSKFEGTR
jgi:hypothetical protein